MEFVSYVVEHRAELLVKIGQHLMLVGVSTGVAIAVGVPLGIWITRSARARGPVLGVANIFQTIPSLALFGFLIPVPFIGGIGAGTAITALIVYALLPIIRNTYAGITGVDRAVRESARGMGMTDIQLLRIVEIPLALPVIVAGIRIAAVIGVGVATIAALIGAGGLGDFIFRGVATVDNAVILTGAVPAAVMALSVDWGLHLLEKRLDWRS